MNCASQTKEAKLLAVYCRCECQWGTIAIKARKYRDAYLLGYVTVESFII